MLEDQGYLNEGLNTSAADALILPMTEDMAAAIDLARKLRDAGIRTQVYGEQKKFKQKMAYADKIGVPFALFLGEDEIQQGKVSLKNMASGQQELLTHEEAMERIVSAVRGQEGQSPILDKGVK